MPDSGGLPGFDPFMKFWTDMSAKMGAAGMAAPTPAPDMMAQMRKTFFGSMSEYAEEYMRSEQFLNGMKQAMDNSLTLKKQVNEFLQSGLQNAQMPSRADTDHIVLLLRGMEDRLLTKMDKLTARIDELEADRNGSNSSASSTKAKATAKRKR